MWLTQYSSTSAIVRSPASCETRASAAAPKIVRVLWCPVRPKGIVAIMAPLLHMACVLVRWCTENVLARHDRSALWSLVNHSGVVHGCTREPSSRQQRCTYTTQERPYYQESKKEAGWNDGPMLTIWASLHLLFELGLILARFAKPSAVPSVTNLLLGLGAMTLARRRTTSPLFAKQFARGTQAH